jgi:hypothetical protein
MKTDGNFRLSKSTKRILGTYTNNPVARSLYKKCMMAAEVSFDKNGYAIQGGKSDKSDKE